MEHHGALVRATDVLAQTALSNVVIIPGVAEAAEIKWFFEQAVADLGESGITWFEVHMAVQQLRP